MRHTLAAISLLSLAVTYVNAETSEDRGLEIAQLAERLDTGFQDFVADGTMVLKDRAGAQSERRFQVRTLEVKGDGDKTLNLFLNPPDVKGTAVLTYSHGVEADDQWVYLPALKRVKRIASSNKTGPFMGSEFAYEDIASREVSKYTYKYLGEEEVDGRPCFMVENAPAYEHSGYTRQIEWFDKEIYKPRKIAFYDRKNTLLKTLVFKDYQQYLGKYWRPNEMFMDNHQTGKKTHLVWNDYRFRTGLTEQDFGQNKLTRVY